MKRVFAIADHLRREGKYSDGVARRRADLPPRPPRPPARRGVRQRPDHGRQRRAVRRDDGAAREQGPGPGPGRDGRGRARGRRGLRPRRLGVGRGPGRRRVVADAADRHVHGLRQAGRAAAADRGAAERHDGAAARPDPAAVDRRRADRRRARTPATAATATTTTAAAGSRAGSASSWCTSALPLLVLAAPGWGGRRRRRHCVAGDGVPTRGCRPGSSAAGASWSTTRATWVPRSRRCGTRREQAVLLPAGAPPLAREADAPRLRPPATARRTPRRRTGRRSRPSAARCPPASREPGAGSPRST